MMRKIHSRERKNGLDAIFITQMILIGILVLYVAVLLFRKGESDTPFAEMEQAVEGVLDNSDMKEADHKMFRRNYRLNANDYDGVMLWFREGTMEVDEILVVKLKSKEQSDTVVEAIEARKKSRKMQKRSIRYFKKLCRSENFLSDGDEGTFQEFLNKKMG